MSWTSKRSIIAAILAFFLFAAEAHADPFHYNVDWITNPSASTTGIALQGGTANYVGTTWTFSGTVKNLSTTTTYNDVRFLVQFLYESSPTPQAFSFNGTNLWTGSNDTFSLITTPSGSSNIPADTNAPAAWTDGGNGTATLVPTDNVPYYTIGTLAPLQTAPFSFTGTSPNGSPLDLVGSFVSTTPLPEPSTLVLAGFGAIGLCMAARRRVLR